MWKKIKNAVAICSGGSCGGRTSLALRSVAPPAAGRLQAEQVSK